jgi:hypothetical protein
LRINLQRERGGRVVELPHKKTRVSARLAEHRRECPSSRAGRRSRHRARPRALRRRFGAARGGALTCLSPAGPSACSCEKPPQRRRQFVRRLLGEEVA